jgi:hypothetical protein
MQFRKNKQHAHAAAPGSVTCLEPSCVWKLSNGVWEGPKPKPSPTTKTTKKKSE